MLVVFCFTPRHPLLKQMCPKLIFFVHILPILNVNWRDKNLHCWGKHKKIKRREELKKSRLYNNEKSRHFIANWPKYHILPWNDVLFSAPKIFVNANVYRKHRVLFVVLKIFILLRIYLFVFKHFLDNINLINFRKILFGYITKGWIAALFKIQTCKLSKIGGFFVSLNIVKVLLTK